MSRLTVSAWSPGTVGYIAEYDSWTKNPTFSFDEMSRRIGHLLAIISITFDQTPIPRCSHDQLLHKDTPRHRVGQTIRQLITRVNRPRRVEPSATVRNKHTRKTWLEYMPGSCQRRYTHTHTHTHIHTHTHTSTHARTHAHTHTHTHIYI